jgi:hypothetical protein
MAAALQPERNYRIEAGAPPPAGAGARDRLPWLGLLTFVRVGGEARRAVCEVSRQVYGDVGDDA